MNESQKKSGLFFLQMIKGTNVYYILKTQVFFLRSCIKAFTFTQKKKKLINKKFYY